MDRTYESYLTTGLEKKYRNLEIRIMEDVVRRIKKTGEITSSADYQLNRYRILGNSTKDIENIVKSAVGDSFPETFELYDQVIEKQYTRSKELYEQVNERFVPYEDNEELQQISEALLRQSNEELFNITKSMGFKVDMGNGRTVFAPLSEYYNEYLDNAMVEITSGAFDYNTVLRRVVIQMVNSGLRTVDYTSGYTSRCDVAARRAVMTGLTQLTGKISDMNARKLHTDYFEIDWHAGARPTHRIWQGKVWSREQLVTVCGLGTVTGLEGANCYHTRYPFFPGISERNYTDAWLDEQNRKEDVPKRFRGREYTAYEATQRQRYLETNMRAQRQKVQLLKEGGADPDDVMIARCKYQAQLDEYKAFSKTMGLPEQRERIYYDMQGRVAPSQRAYKEWQAKQSQKNRNKKHIQKEKMSDIKFATKKNSVITAKQKFEDTITVSQAYGELPIKVKQNMNDVIFEFGHDGSACDIRNKLIRVGIGTSKEEVFHETGHLIENYMMSSADVRKYKEFLVEGLSCNDIIVKTYYDNAGNGIDIYLLKGTNFESEYQSRLYVLNPFEALNGDGTINVDTLGEAISEIFRKYMNGEKISQEAQKLIERAIR